MTESRTEVRRGARAFARRFAVVLSRPESAENIGLAARAMKNTGFEDLRLVLNGPLDPAAYRTAVHAEDVLRRAGVYPDLGEAVAGLHLVFAATARPRKNFEVLPFEAALERMTAAPRRARIGLLFGNERTGLSSEELALTSFRFAIPQASRQPSYNLGSAVLLVLFALFSRSGPAAPSGPSTGRIPLSRREQDAFRRLLLRNLEESGFLHATNKAHMTERISDLLGRLTLTSEDRALLLALFEKAGRNRAG
jgi:tRNA/rRNA methyltransferase